MQISSAIEQLSYQADVIRSLAAHVTDTQARWKPTPEDWSVLEVINHLLDEEREDFRLHLDQCLHHPERPWHSIDPQAWVTERAYNQRELAPSLENFLEERRQSLAWLEGLAAPDGEPDLDAEYHLPWGTLTAGELLASWLAHDLLHARQLVELHYAWNKLQAQPYPVEYAGDW